MEAKAINPKIEEECEHQGWCYFKEEGDVILLVSILVMKSM